MSLETIVIVLCLVGTLIPAVLAVMFWVAPEKGMAMAHHRPEQLPKVMADRYVGMVVLALGALIYGHMGIIAFVTLVLAGTAFADVFIYARAGHSFGPHLVAGLFGLAITVLALIAHFKGTM